jgi:hypothetical protein
LSVIEVIGHDCGFELDLVWLETFNGYSATVSRGVARFVILIESGTSAFQWELIEGIKNEKQYIEVWCLKDFAYSTSSHFSH